MNFGTGVIVAMMTATAKRPSNRSGPQLAAAAHKSTYTNLFAFSVG